MNNSPLFGIESAWGGYVERECSVYYDDRPVGKAVLNRIGLYYEVRCTCQGIHDGKWDLVMTGECGTENLGLLIPVNGKLELRKQIPIKCIGVNDVTFTLCERNRQGEEVIGVHPNLPFPYLHKLQDSYLVTANGACALSFRKKP